MKEKKIKETLKFLLKNVIFFEKNITELAEYLNENQNLLSFQVETKDVIPLMELAEILELKDDEVCEEMYMELLELSECDEDLESNIDIFLNKYLYND